MTFGLKMMLYLRCCWMSNTNIIAVLQEQLKKLQKENAKLVNQIKELYNEQPNKQRTIPTGSNSDE